MVASANAVTRTVLVVAFAGIVLSACIHDHSTDQSHLVSGFVASPTGSRYADSDKDTLESMDGLALSPLSVHVERVYAEDGRGVTSPPDDSVYIESVLRTSTGTYVVNYVIDGEKTSIDFDMEELASYDSLFGQTTHDNHSYGFQVYRDLGSDDDPAPRDYVATARFFTFERRPGLSPYDGTVYELFGTYGLKTSPENLFSLGSASFEGNIFGNIWDVGDPNRNTGLDLLRGTLALEANLDSGDISGAFQNLRRFDYDAENRAWKDLAETVSIEIGPGTIAAGRFTANWQGRDSGDTLPEDSVSGFAGNMLGEFFGPAGEEIGGVWRGHRDATAATPEQLISGFFSGGREPGDTH
jgi:hypothetical protein